MRFGTWEIRERFDLAGGGTDALAVGKDGREARLWIGGPGSAAAPVSPDGLRARLGRIYHASLPTVIGAETVEDRAVLVLSPYRGRRLSEELASGPLDPPEALDVVRAAAAALVKAHRAGVYHGALGADDLLRAEDGRTLLLHLGWGAFLGPRPPRAPGGDAAAGSEETDVFALARVLVHCLEGRDPLPDDPEALSTFPTSPPRTADSFRASLPEGLRRLLARALHPDPARRTRRAEELAGDLGVLRASWASLHQPPPRPSLPFPPLLHPRLLAAGAGGLVLLALLLLRSCGQKAG